MGAAVVRRQHLDVVVSLAPVHLVLDAEVWEVDLVVDVRQLVLPCPALDLAGGPVRSTVAVRAVPVVRLEELLVLPLQVLFEDDAADVGVGVFAANPELLDPVRFECRRVVFHLAGAAQPGVELLPVLVGEWWLEGGVREGTQPSRRGAVQQSPRRVGRRPQRDTGVVCGSPGSVPVGQPSEELSIASASGAGPQPARKRLGSLYACGRRRARPSQAQGFTGTVRSRSV